MNKKYFGWFFGFLLVSGGSWALEISEIMYNPTGTSESGREWIEIYNEDNFSVNVTSFQLFENNKVNNITLLNGSSLLSTREYALIITNQYKFLADYPNYNKALFLSSFGLSNSRDYLRLDENGVIRDEVNYSSGCDDGYSLELKNVELDNGLRSNWGSSLVLGGTPGEVNSINGSEISNLPNLILSINFPLDIYSGLSYEYKFNITIENKLYSGKDNVTIEYNITGDNFLKKDIFTKEVGRKYTEKREFTPTSPGVYLFCANIINSTVNETDYSDNYACQMFKAIDAATIPCQIDLSIQTEEGLVYQQGESIKFKFQVNNESFPFTIDYWIEDLFGNLAKSHYTTTNTNQKSWKTATTEQDRVLFVKAQLNPSCNDTNLSDNRAEKMFIVIDEDIFQEINNSGSGISKENQSTINILKISPEEPNFGDLVKVDLEIYRGNTNKYVVYAQVKKGSKELSEKTKVSLNSKYTTYKLSLPLQLKLNCDQKLEEGEAQVVIEGLDRVEEEEITIKGESGWCETSSSESSEGSSSEAEVPEGEEELSYEFLDLPLTLSSFPLNFKVRLKGDEWDHFFQVYAYLYRGSRCYSCEGETKEREDDLQEFFLGFEEEKIIDFSLSVDGGLKEGDYKLKVKLHKDGQFTAKELGATLHITSEEGQVEEQSLLTSAAFSSTEEPESIARAFPNLVLKPIDPSRSLVVYESNSTKAKKTIVYFLLISLGLVCLILLKKK